jgi:thiol-disulfide isomerase/thioredoxin
MHRLQFAMAISCAALTGALAPVVAQDKKESPELQPEPALKVGDPAPPLTVTRWLQGKEVRSFEPGKVYVVDFWATWCGACIRFLPHMADLQARYKDEGVTIISFTSRDIRGVPDNTEERVAAFVKRRGPMLKHTFAYAESGTTFDAWMKGRDHFPVFVVDKSGRIAYIGSSMFLDVVLPKVLASGNAKAGSDDLAKVDADYRALCDSLERDRSSALRALEEFEAKYPPLADSLPVVYVKLQELVEHGEPGTAKAYAETVVAKATRQNNVPVLQLVYLTLCTKKERKELHDLIVRSAESLVHVDGGAEPESLLRLADAYLVSGDKAKAKDCARKAIDAAAGESLADRQEIEKKARSFGAGN